MHRGSADRGENTRYGTRNNAHTDIRYSMVGKLDKNGDDYFVGFSKHPVLLDMANTVFFFYPYGDEGDETFGGELVIRRRWREEEKPGGDGMVARNALQEAIMLTLTARFGPVPKRIENALLEIDTLETLNSTLRSALTEETAMAFDKGLTD